MSLPPPSKKQANIIWIAATGLAIAIIVALVVAAVWGLGKVLHVLSPVIWPIAVAGVVACLLDPVVDYLKKKGLPRTRAIGIVFFAAFVLIVGIFASIVPQLVVQTEELVQRFPDYRKSWDKQWKEVLEHPPAWLKTFFPQKKSTTTENSGVTTNGLPAQTEVSVQTTNILPVIVAEKSSALPAFDLNEATLSSATDWIAKALPALGKSVSYVLAYIGSWFGIIAGLALIPIYSFYFLLEKRGIESKWTDYLPVQESKFKDELVFVMNAINDYLIAFFRGQVLVALSDGILYTIGFSLIGLPYAILIGVMATFLTIIPFLGAIVTCIAALIISVVTYGDWQHPAMVVGVFTVIQGLEGFLIQPKIMGDRVGLHPMTIIIALMVGTTLLGGILGGILAIPLTAALRVVMFRYVWKKRDPQKG